MDVNPAVVTDEERAARLAQKAANFVQYWTTHPEARVVQLDPLPDVLLPAKEVPVAEKIEEVAQSKGKKK